MYFFVYIRNRDNTELVCQSFESLKKLLQWTKDNGIYPHPFKTKIIGPEGEIEYNGNIERLYQLTEVKNEDNKKED